MRSRRSRSIALLRAVRMIQPAGLSGIPRVGQVRKACTKASWTATSARSKLPVARISAATARPASRRNRRSRSWRGSPVASAFRSGGEVLNGAQLDRSEVRAGTAGTCFYRLVEVRDLEKVIPAELLLRFRKWSIGDNGFAVESPHGCRRRRQLKSVSAQVPTLLCEPVAVVVPDLDLSFSLLRRCACCVGLHCCLVAVDQQQILHPHSLFTRWAVLSALPTFSTITRTIPRPIVTQIQQHCCC